MKQKIVEGFEGMPCKFPEAGRVRLKCSRIGPKERAGGSNSAQLILITAAEQDVAHDVRNVACG